MVDDAQFGSGRPADGYTAPPPTAPPPPGYPAGGYGAPVSYPGYPPPGYPAGQLPPGYPMYPPPGYALAPQQDPRDRRPGTVTAAAVLGYVNAGFMVICGIILITGASLVHDTDVYGAGNSISAELAVDAVLNLIAAGLLIGGSIAVTNRSVMGRRVYSVGAVVVIGLSLYWLLRFDDVRRDGVIFYSLLFGAIAVVGLSMAWAPGGTTWFANSPRRAHRTAT